MEDRIRAEIASKREGGNSSTSADGADGRSDDGAALREEDLELDAPPPQSDSDNGDAPPEPEEEKEDYGARSTASLLQEIDQSIQAGPDASVGRSERDLNQLLELLGECVCHSLDCCVGVCVSVSVSVSVC